MNVVIVEDDYIVSDNLEMILKDLGIFTLKIATNYEEAVDTISLNPDFYFVDIRLNGIKTGIDLGKKLFESNIPFAYLTANNEIKTLKEAIKYAPIAYISKPYRDHDIVALIELLKQKNKLEISVKSTFGKKIIPLNSIKFIKSDGAYVEIHSVEGIYRERNNLSYFQEIDPNLLLRVHRSYLVNKKRIDQFNSKLIYIEDDTIPISRTFRNEIQKALH